MTAEIPEDYSPPVDEDEIRDALSAVDAAASNHGADYSAGMREARRIVETRLLGNGGGPSG